MCKQEFLSQLRARLGGLPHRDVEERLNFYGEMIDDRMEEGRSEDEAVSDIGSVEEIAAHFFVSASTISHHFKSRMGISIMKYIRHKRLLLAKTLLEKGEKPQKAAEKAGFREYSTFYKAYVQHFGEAPSR